MKLQQLKNKQFIISLPSQIIRAKNWNKGDVIKVEIDKEGNIVLRK
ncbi:MAG: AbrB/MazE/SpoVT family DNA-binding domain-containing protein [Nanoarchaeota archaeon]